MEPMANSSWVFGEIELSGETVDDETLSCRSTSPSVPESSDCGTDVVYALFSVGVVQEPTGVKTNDDVRRQHFDTEVKMDAARITKKLMITRPPSPVNTFKLRPVLWDEVYQPRKAKRERKLNAPFARIDANVRKRLDWSMLLEDNSY